ncbi:MAG: hypothetical protein SOV26_04660 [Candidatus Onthovivens sp.]|nr:hypothetical protein [Candidatus Onthovivens sp.]
MTEKRLYPAKGPLLKTYSIISLILLLIAYLAFGSRFMYANKTHDELMSMLGGDFLILCIRIILNIIAVFVLLKRNYYEISKNAITHIKLGVSTTYNFSDIIYIDESYSKKEKTILFYLKDGKEIYLINDKEKIISATLKENCKNLLSRSQFITKYKSKNPI